jgi:ubiquitin-like 1-activating enzyme E1 B
MGSDDFSRKVFEKVYTHDINRLRGMEDMWKTRKPPQALDYNEVAKRASSVDVSVAQLNQITWTLLENFTVFRDR